MTAVERLQRFVDRFPSLSQAALSLGINKGNLSRMLRGLRPVTDATLARLGYRREVTIKPIRKAS